MGRPRTTRYSVWPALVTAFAVFAAAWLPIAAAQRPSPFPSPTPPRPKAPPRKDRGPLALFPLDIRWTLSLNNALATSPGYDETRGYFPLEGGRLAAYTLESGTELWLVAIDTTRPPVAGDGLVFLVEAEALTALRADTGTLVWRLPFAGRLAVPLVWDNGWLVAATTEGRVIAFRAIDGHEVWRRDLDSPAHAPPSLGGDRVYVPLEDGRIVALGVTSGDLIWERRLGGAPNEILPLENELFLGSKDNFFYCVRPRDGEIEWRARTGADVIGLPVVDERTVYFVSLDNILRALSRTTGVQRWLRLLPLRPSSGPLRAADALVVTGVAPTLRAYHTLDGTPAGDLPLPNELAGAPHLYADPQTSGPVVILALRDVAKGATVGAVTRSIELPIATPAALPNQLPAEPPPPQP